MGAKQVIVTKVTRVKKSDSTPKGTKSNSKGQKRCPTCGKYR